MLGRGVCLTLSSPQSLASFRRVEKQTYRHCTETHLVMSGQEQGQRQRRKLPKPPLGANSPNKLRSDSSLVQPSTKPSNNVTPIRTSSASNVADTNRQLLNFSPPGTKPREFLGYTSPEPEQASEWEDSSVTVAVRVRPFSER